MGKVRSENRIDLPELYPIKTVLILYTKYLNQAIHFPAFAIVRMSYIAYSMDWKLKEAVINDKKTEIIISYPDL